MKNEHLDPLESNFFARHSPVGIPNSLLPLPKPLTTSPRQKYGQKFVMISEGILATVRSRGDSQQQDFSDWMSLFTCLKPQTIKDCAIAKLRYHGREPDLRNPNSIAKIPLKLWLGYTTWSLDLFFFKLTRSSFQFYKSKTSWILIYLCFGLSRDNRSLKIPLRLSKYSLSCDQVAKK